MMIDYYHVAIIIGSLIFSAFFSGMEIAFISSNKLHIELQKAQGGVAGKILANFVKKPSEYIATTLTGNTIALVVYGIFMAGLLEPFITNWIPQEVNNDVAILIVQTLIATFIVLVTAEFTPKSIFLLNPDRLFYLFAVPMWILYWILYPIVIVIITLSKFFIVKILRLEYSEDQPVFGLIDLNNYINNTIHASHDYSSHSKKQTQVELNTKIFNNALEFKTIKIRDCMIPRTEIAAVEINDGIEALKQAFIASGHSKIPIYRDSIDDIIGYCHSLQMFKKPKDISGILTPIIIVPETLLANELMIQFINERKSIALVVDEFGGTSGIVTIEDIIEEIFGEIQDEHDVEDLVEQQLEENVYLISARQEIDYLNEKYHWEIPEGDYDTLGGFILSVTEDLPNLNDIIDIPPFTFTIIAMQDARIDIVKIMIRDMPEDEG